LVNSYGFYVKNRNRFYSYRFHVYVTFLPYTWKCIRDNFYVYVIFYVTYVNYLRYVEVEIASHSGKAAVKPMYGCERRRVIRAVLETLNCSIVCLQVTASHHVMMWLMSAHWQFTDGPDDLLHTFQSQQHKQSHSRRHKLESTTVMFVTLILYQLYSLDFTLHFLLFVSEYLILFLRTCSLATYHLWHWIAYNMLMCR